MADESLEERIMAKREKQAEEREISEKAGCIAKFARYKEGGEGNIGPKELPNGITSEKYIFKGSGLEIEDSSYFQVAGDGAMAAFGTTIKYKSRTVYEDGGGGLRSYVPGKWEKLLDALYLKASKRESTYLKWLEKKKQKEEKAKKEALKSRWGRF